MYLLDEDLEKLKDKIEDVRIDMGVATASLSGSDMRIVLFALHGKTELSFHAINNKGHKLFEIVNAEDVLSIVYDVSEKNNFVDHEQEFLKVIESRLCRSI